MSTYYIAMANGVNATTQSIGIPFGNPPVLAGDEVVTALALSFSTPSLSDVTNAFDPLAPANGFLVQNQYNLAGNSLLILMKRG